MSEVLFAEPPPPVDEATPESRAKRGRELRAAVPRSTLGSWKPSADRPDPVELLKQQATTRVADLIPIRHGRMVASAFSFYRGAAVVMAADLASSPSSGLRVQLCGDAHLANFGGFASPERDLVFDVNDFDETLPGPFEWDVKRLVASVEVAGRSRGLDAAECSRVVKETARSYREAIRQFATLRRLDVWYSRLDAEEIFTRWGRGLSPAELKRVRRLIVKAESKDQLKARSKLTELVGRELKFRADPPLLVPAADLLAGPDHQRLVDTIDSILDAYRATLHDDRRHMLEGYRFVDLARKVVGVGSVGTRVWVALLVGRDNDDPLFLQVKEAEASVLEPFLEPSTYPNHGQRVVEGQRLMQASSDIFLGWNRVDGIDGRTHDYYMRQLWDWKASADLTTMDAAVLAVYGQMCGWVLARSHARSGDPITIGAYLGSGAVFDDSLARFASSYADQNASDHQQLVDAIASGDVEAAQEV